MIDGRHSGRAANCLSKRVAELTAIMDRMSHVDKRPTNSEERCEIKMAFIDQDSVDPTGPTFYNVFSAVGVGCPNMEEDVKVVQFFLQRFFSLTDFKDYKPWGTMTVDGKVGPVTRAWILKSQLVMRHGGVNVSVDGVVDKAGAVPGAGNRESTISHTDYAIRMLNNALRKRDTAVYKSLSTNPEVPEDVREIFKQINAAGPPMNFGNN